MYYVAVAIFFSPWVVIGILFLMRRRLRNRTSTHAEDQASETDPAPSIGWLMDIARSKFDAKR